MSSISVMIVDDEPFARRYLRSLLSKEADIHIVGECRNGLEAVQAIADLKPDLVFLDVQMPGLNGFGVIERVGPTQMPSVIFVTAFDAFAIKAFEHAAFDYLLKPFAAERVRQSLERFRHTQLTKRQLAKLAASLAELIAGQPDSPSASRTVPATPTAGHRAKGTLSRVYIEGVDSTYTIPVESIDWCEAYGDYTRIHAGGKTHLLKQRLVQLEEELDPSRFIRVNRQTVVQIDHVKGLQNIDESTMMVVLRDGAKHRLSRRRRAAVESAMGKRDRRKS